LARNGFGKLGVTSLLLGSCLGLRAAAAEERHGSVAGRVTDESGSALPGVTVEARGPAIAASRVTATDRAGSYVIADLPAGVYGLFFRLPNFAQVTRSGVALPGGGVTRVDVVLQLAVTADVVVTGKTTFRNLADLADAGESLIGVASSAAQGTVSGKQIDARPTLRPGEVLENVPGLLISQHSGEGKANQYYLRGFNLDHGTDFATSVVGVPVNMPSHAHGQGYADLNFLIPELVSGVQYEKGPYAAEQGDFSTAGSASIRYVNALEKGIARAGGGPEGYGRALVAQSPRLFDGTLLWAVEVTHNDGPWTHPDNMRKYNGVLRYSQEGEDNALSITAMGYQNKWNSTDQVADRAILDGSISRFGAIDPTDGGETHRYSLSADWQKNGVDSLTRATAYAVDYGLTLFSNFTYYLDDPVNGDQFEQADKRVVTGFNASQQWLSGWFGRETQNTVGIQVRNDNIAENGLFHTKARKVLETVRLDHILQTSASLYFENSVRWSEKLRTVLGVRWDYYRFHVRGDDPANSGDDHESLASPKLSVVLGPWGKTEFYANAGDGFHSNDARGATITEDPKTHEPVERVTPLVRAKGAEVGMRTVLVPHLQTTVSLWGLDIGSELVFTGDAGTTEASRPSRRAGIELANSWSPLHWLVLDADVAVSRARLRDFDPVGDRIPGAVETVVSAGVSVEDVSGLSGSLRLRYFGPRPLIEDNSVRSKSSTLVNAQIGHGLGHGARLALDVFNVFNASVSDIDYYYASRLPGEPAAGVNDIHTHPSEPRSARVSVLYSF
jgi:hypothetical protein